MMRSTRVSTERVAKMETRNNTPVLAIEDLDICLPPGADRPYAVKGSSFEIFPGEILCIVGESGSGKSMSANAVMGLLPPGVHVDSGRIIFDKSQLLDLSEEQLREIRGAKIGMIFQEPLSALNPLIRVGDQIKEVFEVHGRYDAAEREERMLSLLAEVGIPEPERSARAYPFQLSGGQRQRVMIAAALALAPVLLIADEPTTALDVTTQAQVLDLIKRLQESHGTAVLFITHDFGVVREIADRVLVMQYGEIVEAGTAEEVLTRPKHPYTQRLINAIPKDTDHEAVDLDASVPLLRIEGLQKTYSTRPGVWAKRRVVHAIKNVSLDVIKGETLGVVGESGSGKSTLGRCILRLVEPTAGKVLLGDTDVTGLPNRGLRHARRDMQMVFQDPFSSLNPRHKVVNIIADNAVAQGAGKAEAREKALALLETVGLGVAAANRYPHEFSGGQRQRIGIARALITDPKLVIADEAVSALDVSIQAQVLELLERLKQDLDLTLVFITHDLLVAAAICDRVAVMQQGEVVELGPARQVFSEPAHPYTRSLIAAIPGRQTRENTGQVAEIGEA